MAELQRRAGNAELRQRRTKSYYTEKRRVLLGPRLRTVDHVGNRCRRTVTSVLQARCLSRCFCERFSDASSPGPKLPSKTLVAPPWLPRLLSRRLGSGAQRPENQTSPIRHYCAVSRLT